MRLRRRRLLRHHGWNADDTLASRIDGSAGSSLFGYDWAARLTSMASPVYSGTLTFGWRLDGLLDGRQWPSGAGGAATFSYDLAKRPTAFAKAGTAAASFSQTYDRDGNVTSEGRSLSGVSGNAGSATQSFTYDGLRWTRSRCPGGCLLDLLLRFHLLVVVGSSPKRWPRASRCKSSGDSLACLEEIAA